VAVPCQGSQTVGMARTPSLRPRLRRALGAGRRGLGEKLSDLVIRGLRRRSPSPPPQSGILATRCACCRPARTLSQLAAPPGRGALARRSTLRWPPAGAHRHSKMRCAWCARRARRCRRRCAGVGPWPRHGARRRHGHRHLRGGGGYFSWREVRAELQWSAADCHRPDMPARSTYCRAGFCKKSRGQGAQCERPFHSPLMAPAAKVLEARLGEIRISPLAFPLCPTSMPGQSRRIAGAAPCLVRQVRRGGALGRDHPLHARARHHPRPGIGLKSAGRSEQAHRERVAGAQRVRSGLVRRGAGVLAAAGATL